MKILSNLAVCFLGIFLFGFVIVTIDAADRVGPREAYPSAPGHANPEVTQANIATTICQPSKDAKDAKTFSKRERPTTSKTNPEKFAAMKAAGITDSPKNWEWDHMIPISGGGAPDDARNESLQSYVSQPFNAHVKDKVEDAIHAQVCAGTIKLADAQKCISSDWIACGIRLKVKAVTDVWTKYEASLTKKK